MLSSISYSLTFVPWYLDWLRTLLTSSSISLFSFKITYFDFNLMLIMKPADVLMFYVVSHTAFSPFWMMNILELSLSASSMCCVETSMLIFSSWFCTSCLSVPHTFSREFRSWLDVGSSNIRRRGLPMRARRTESFRL